MMELSSLSKMAFETILNNIGRYKELITSKLSPPVREMLCQEMMKRMRKIGPEQVWAALPFLEPHKTAERFLPRDFQWILEMKPGRSGVSMDELLRYLVQHAPNLKEINIREILVFVTKRRRFIDKRPLLKKGSTDLICQMKNLKTIWINTIAINFSGFVRICMDCENLQNIEADRVLVDVHPKSMKMSLKQFVSVFDHQEYIEGFHPRQFKITFKKTNAQYVSTSIRLDDSSLLGFIYSIPQITHMEIFGGKDSCEIHRILRKKGGNLKKLSLISVDPKLKIKFKCIFEFCKNLESLYLKDMFISDDVEPINSFAKLKELYWDNGIVGHPMKLQNILSAPLLEKIMICVYQFDLGNKEAFFKSMMNLIGLTGTNCFQQLKRMLQFLLQPS
ncbi:Hypothetical predicted protein [Cloeon dipterum]|uniref:FBD domain-containing protein n=1 Tax=Cloeon dipterum TaxID=197152 RepID=A0A8S1DTV4_9INSE|nr:Hypothetical predicted protein [Cloeon dipterum]